MASRWALLSLGLALGGALLAAGCDKKPPAEPTDAGPDLRPLPDTGVPMPTPQTVDFTVINCPMFDGAKPQCAGPAPLTVSFAPVTSGPIASFLWDFGDQTTSFEPFPTHTYATPDSYDVSLVSAGASSLRPAFILVTTNPLGGACDVSPQCAPPTTCLCGQSGGQCPAAFTRGICAVSCATSECPAGPPAAVCAELGLGYTVPGGGEPPAWRRPLCLRACTNDAECARGQRCRLVPVARPAEGWQRACFFDFPGEAGAACRGASGAVQDDLCLGGRCADLGTRGVCASDCGGGGSCPPGTTCSAFKDGRKLCLRTCTAGATCDRDDPLLACAAPGGLGPLGFTFTSAAAPGLMVCAPRPCASDTDCRGAGTCMGAPSGNCVRTGP